MKHTPTPWRVAERWHVITDDNGQWLADTVTVQRLNEEEAANAAFIVRAVNSHNALVDALRDALGLILENGIDECDQYEKGRDLLVAIASNGEKS